MNIRRFILAMVIASAVAVVLFVVGAIRNHSFDYWYLTYNLVLAAIPLGVAIWLRTILERYTWRDWRSLILLIVWLLFLPNSFYILTDFIHLPETHRVDIIQDIVMLTQYSIVGFVMGFASLSLLHDAYLKRLKARTVTVLVYVTLWLASFAIYLGRELRWNSWDIVSNPVGLFGDVWSIIFHPFLHIGMISMLLSYFAMLMSLYWMLRVVVKK